MQEPAINQAKEYTPYDFPPDLDVAKLHFDNNQFGPDDPNLTEKERKARTDPYSHQGPKKLYKLDTKVENMTSNGLETMLYFKSLKFIYIFIGLYAATQIFPYIRLVRLYYSVNCQQSCSYVSMFYEVTQSMLSSTAGNGQAVGREEFAKIMSEGYIFFTVMIGVIWVIFFKMRYDVEMSSMIFKRKVKPTVSDYTIMIGNVDQDAKDEVLVEALKMQMAMHELGEPEILQITRGRFLDDHDTAIREFLEAEKKLEEFRRGKELNYFGLDDLMKKKFLKIEEDLLKNYEKTLAKKKSVESKPREDPGLIRRVNTVAFITIKSAEQAELLLRYESYQTVLEHICLVPRLIIRFFNCGKKHMKFLPPPPTEDILWSHIGSCTFKRYLRYILMALAYTPFIIFFMFMLIIATIVKARMKSNGKVGFITKIIFEYLIPYALVKISHIVTDKVLLWLSGIGKGITVSNQRNILIQFNYFFRYTACLLALKIKLVLRKLRLNNNEVTDTDVFGFYSTQVFFYVLCDVGVGAAKKIIDYPMLFTKLKIMWFEIQNKKRQGAGKTQSEVNKIFTKPKFELMDQYIKMMFLTYFVYSFNIYCPLTTFIIFIYVILKIWKDKESLVKNRKPADETQHIFSDFAWNVTFPLGIVTATKLYTHKAGGYLLYEAPIVGVLCTFTNWFYVLIFYFNFFIQSFVLKLAHKNFDKRMQREMLTELGASGGVNPEVSFDNGRLSQNFQKGGAGDGDFKPRPEFNNIIEMEEGLGSPGYLSCLEDYLTGGWFSK